MMKSSNLLLYSFLFFMLISCKKADDITPSPPVNPGNSLDTATALKDATDIPIGVAVSYTGMINNPAYLNVVKRDFNSITLENEMKHSSIVQSNGSFNFTRADAIVNAASGMQIFGHTLGWHAQQNATYLKNFAANTSGPQTNLISNPGFESGLSGWSTFNASNGATISVTNAVSEIRTGTGAMKVVNPVANPGNQWRVQVSGPAFQAAAGKQYTISYWVKAATAGGSIRLSSGPTNAQYQGDQVIGTSYQQVSWTITNSANLSSMTFLFDMGEAANTYYIDDVSVTEAQGPGTLVASKLDEALKNYITAMVSRYKDKVKAWDVVNELFAENGALRNNNNTSITPPDVLVWSHYLGRDYALKAFNYAREADPTALLFINDYNLESSTAKLDSLIAMVVELKTRGAKVDGIGTQMHISINSRLSGIDDMFRKLAATGLKVRISELDIRVNPENRADFVLTPAISASHSDMYKYVVKSYLANVPKAQQHGITMWGLTDNTSWLYNNGRDFPLLYNADFSKKPAYTGVLQALKGK